jgi:uncharacterized membrane protein
MVLLIILSRWLHIVAACLAIGGFFFIRVILPIGLAVLEPENRDAAALRTRRAFKMVVHSAILLLILTGVFNTMVAWSKYNLNPPMMHPLWGTHVLLALIAFSIALYVLAGPKPPTAHRKLMTVNLVVLLLTVATASTLKWARDTVVAGHSNVSLTGNP